MVSKRPFSFDVEELQELLLDPCSLVRVKRSIRHIALHPSSLGDLRAAIKQMLNQLLNRFDQNFGGFLLGYKHVTVTTTKGTVVNDDYSVHFDIEADFYIFTPEVGCVLYGFVNKKSRDHIGCLVHKFFNVSILRPSTESSKEWLGKSVGIGDKVTFSLKLCDFTGNLPYMQGTLMSSSPAKENTEVLSPKKKKRKRSDSAPEDTQEEVFTVPEIEFVSSPAKENTEDLSPKKKKHKRSDSAPEDTQEEVFTVPEIDFVLNPAKKNKEVLSPKKKKHKRGDSVPEGTHEKIFTVPEIDLAESNKRKWDSGDDVDGTRKKKNKKRKLEEDQDDNPEQSNSLHMSSEHPEYGQIIQHIKEVYLKEDTHDEEPNKEKDKKKHKKRTLYTVLDESVGIEHDEKEEVYASEQVKSKKKKHKEKHGGEDETVSVGPDFNTLWKNFEGRSKKLKENMNVSLNSSGLEIESSESQKDEIGSKEPVTKHKKKKDKHKTSDCVKKHVKKGKEAESSLDVSSLKIPDNIILEDPKNLLSQLSDEAQTNSPLKLKSSKSISPKKHKKKDKEAIDSLSVLGVSPIKTSNKISLENFKNLFSQPTDETLANSPEKQNTLSQVSLDDDLPMITQHITLDAGKLKKNNQKTAKNENSKLLDPLTRIAPAYSDSDDSEEDSDKLNSPTKLHISANSTFHKLAASMANSAEHKRPKLSKGITMSERRSLPILKHSSVGDFEMDHFENLLSPLTPAGTSSGEKKKKSVNFNNQDLFLTPVNILSSKSKLKNSPILPETMKDSDVMPEATMEHSAVLDTPSSKKSKKQKKSPIQKLVTSNVSSEETNISKKQTSPVEKLELSNVKSIKDTDIACSGTEFSSNIVLPDVDKIFKVLNSPSSETKSPLSKQATAKNTPNSLNLKEILRAMSSPNKLNKKKANVKSKKDKTKEKSKVSGKDKKKKKDKKEKNHHSDEKVKKNTNDTSLKKDKKKKKKDGKVNDVRKLSNDLLLKFLQK